MKKYKRSTKKRGHKEGLITETIHIFILCVNIMCIYMIELTLYIYIYIYMYICMELCIFCILKFWIEW